VNYGKMWAFSAFCVQVMAKILLVEDDLALQRMLLQFLELEKHTIDTASNGQQAKDLLEMNTYELLLLDLTLPDTDGLEICKWYRDKGGLAKVMMLTGRRETADKISGLDTGADEYLTKPFDARELSARIRALLRRPESMIPDIIKMGSLELDMKERLVRKAGLALKLAPKEFAMLEFFMRNPSEVFSSDRLLNSVWHAESEATHESVRVCINRLRTKLGTGADVPQIETAYSVGYKLIPPGAGDASP
jgi:DNA-binding response OmpR family regulator